MDGYEKRGLKTYGGQSMKKNEQGKLLRKCRSLLFVTSLSLSSFGPITPINSIWAETANIGDPGGCPFENSSSTSDSIAKVKASLQTLAGSSDACGETIGASAASLSSLLDGILDSSFPVTEIDVDGSTTLTCDNYVAILAKEKSLAMEAKNNEYFVVGTDFLTRYARCEIFTRPEEEVNEEDLQEEYHGLSQSQRYDLCVDTIYQETFYRKVEECDIIENIEYENNKNQAYKDQITQVTEMATNLISSSEGCSKPDILRNITQSIIPLITTLGTYSVSGPFLGAGVAFGGNLASALVDRFFNTDGPNEYIDLLEGESEWENLNCLYYQVQNEALACNAPDFEEIPPLERQVSCEAQRENQIIDDISDLSLIIKSLANSTSPLGKAERADQIRDLLNKEITYPDGSKTLKLSEYLKEVADGLSNDPSRSADLFQASRLNKIIDNIDEYNGIVATSPIDAEKVMENNAALHGLVKDGSGVFDLVDTVSRYWNRQERTYSSGMIGRLKAVETASPLASIVPLDDSDMQSSESTKIAHDALVDLYKGKFEKRLQDQQETYLSNRKPKTDSQRNSNLDYIIPLFQSCTLNSGMFHYAEKNNDTHSINLIGTPSEEYSNICAKFKCPDGSLLPEFKVDNTPGSDSAGTQFKRYQCAVKAQYNQLYKKLVRRYRETGEICPPPRTANPNPVRNASDNREIPGSASRVPSQYISPEGNAYQAYDPDAAGYGRQNQNQGGGFFGAIGNFFGGIFNFLFGWMK